LPTPTSSLAVAETIAPLKTAPTVGATLSGQVASVPACAAAIAPRIAGNDVRGVPSA